MEEKKFRKLVMEAIDELPEDFKRKISNLYVVVEDFPSGEILKEQGIKSPYSILGLYQGIPVKKRGVSYTNFLPDRITIYQKPIESLGKEADQVKERVKEVFRHELGHHFGFSETELAKIDI
ncbi:MAG: metallopeptidase family protein [Candidatus Omnitrophica bacterium]|nr:metallopeptidase family protein [Candidatus Omnitrophota bacterium]